MVSAMLRLAFLGSLALCSLGLACTSTEPPPQPPVKEGKADPEVPEPTARAVIASVQLIQDCPNNPNPWRAPPANPSPSASPKQAAAAAMPASPPLHAGDVAEGARLAGEGSGDWAQPCTQSTVQVGFSSLADAPARVEIEAVRLLDPKTGKKVALLKSREPVAWAGDAYQPWNEMLGPRQEVQSSYVLSVPDWSEVHEAMGIRDSYGTMFLLELDVSIGGQRQSIRSAEFPREEPHVIVT